MTEQTAGPNTFGSFGPLGWRSLEPIAPIVAFLVLNRLGGLRVAVAGATLWSIKIAVDRKRRNEAFGVVLPVITLAMIARGVAGIITESEDVYFGLGIAGKYLIAAALLVSAVVGRPLAQRGAPLLLNVSKADQAHPAWHRAMIGVTVTAGLYYLASATLDVFLLQRNSVEGYVVIRFLVNWPLSMVAIAVAGAVMQRQLRTIPGLAPLTELIEARIDEYTQPNSAPTEAKDR